MKRCQILYLLIFLVGSIRLFAQSNHQGLDTLASHFITNLHNADKEKIILKTDRRVYAAGEKVWFKAFLVRALDNGLDTVSKNLFVDLLNNENKTFAKLVLNVAKLKTNGAITLSDSLASGYYWLRCYTQQMVNCDSAGIFLQPLYVFNARRPGTDDTASTLVATNNKKIINSYQPNVHFYAEGGTMITGMVSSAALRVTDNSGNPLSLAGRVVVNDDSTITSFTTNGLGLARISFYPKWFDKYTIIIRENGTDIKYPLNIYNPFAARLSVESQNDGEIKAVVALEDSIYSKNFTTYIIGISRDRVCFESIGKGMYEAAIPTGNFRGGIATLLLFDENQNLLSERSVCINKSNYSIKVQADKQGYSARDNVHMAINIEDGNGQPLVAALNVSVQTEKIQTVSDLMEKDTLSPISSVLNDWFDNRQDEYSAADIDLLMLARPYNYNNWRGDSVRRAGHIIDETALLTGVQGRIADKKDKVIKGMVVTAMAKENQGFFFDVDTTNTEGRFQLRIPENQDSLVLQLQVTNAQGKPQLLNRILLDSFEFPHFVTPAFLVQHYTVESINMAERIRFYHTDTVFKQVGKDWLKPVTVHTVVKEQPNYDVTKRINPFSHIITADMFSHGGVNSIPNSLLFVPGITMRGRYVIVLGGGGFGAGPTTEPIVIMDGVQMPVLQMYPPNQLNPVISPVMNFLNSLSPNDIDFIEVLTNGDAGIFGVRSANGAIVINTKSGNRNASDNSGYGFKIVHPVTYHAAPEFKMPNYADKAIKNSKSPDPRVTIYWNGNIITNLNGKASVSFYTADEPSAYVVTVTGITANGDYINKRITINRP